MTQMQVFTRSLIIGILCALLFIVYGQSDLFPNMSNREAIRTGFDIGVFAFASSLVFVGGKHCRTN